MRWPIGGNFELPTWFITIENIKYLLLNHTAVMEIVVTMVIGFIRLVYVEINATLKYT
jgi:hypothetical protein